MGKLRFIITVIVLFATTVLFGQNRKLDFGLKGGLNYGKYIPNKSAIDYKYKFGFYAGAFYSIELDEKIKFQPELMFALQGSHMKVGELEIPNFDWEGNPIYNPNTYEFKYGIHELSILIPLMVKRYVWENLYIGIGPQFGFIVDRNLNSSYQVLDGEDDSFIIRDGDTFNFGVNFGLGVDMAEKISINSRINYGLLKRDDDIKLLVFNLGIEYSL
ncbi:PorT family protein [Flavobacteriaceae bacterium F89]|uniref:PorT family protein n=1 Tax=Cerina litoralis TaxID=2874477 RepID=A0AAE3EWH4_9FLAO|nr:porin family protein [Cerina litoralis]MCG2460987.1 PorT family protein [Cerina litoralis]